jgi:NDP-sugar pyrophosphorylase family protein
MQAILLATGETGKLQPLTNSLPSAMLPVANRPVMGYPLQLLARQGVKRVFVSLYHLGGSIESYFGDGRRWGVAIEYLLQREAWGTAGAIKWAAPLVTQTFVVMPADALVDVDLEAVLAYHRHHQGVATVVVDAGGQSTAPGAPRANTGVYIFEPEALDFVPPRTAFDIDSQLLPALAAAGKPVHTFALEGYCNPLATFTDYQQLQRDFLYSAWTQDLAGTAPIRYAAVDGRNIAPGIWVGRNNIIHPAVRMAPPLCIGDNCLIGRDAELGPESVIDSNIIIDDEATVHHSTVLAYTYVGQLLHVGNRFVQRNVIIDAHSGQSTEIVDRFLLDEANPAILDFGLRRIMDFTLALLLLVFTLPLTLPLGLLLWLSGGALFTPVERVGTRPGLRGKGPGGRPETVSLLWFCTRDEDGRLTWIGRWLERWDVCRLPELWHVLKGDLGLIGVKPLTLEEAGRLTEEWQQKRYDYHAGFVGLWYVQTEVDSDWEDVLVADAYYAATRDWREDLRLLWQTPAAWYRRVSRQNQPVQTVMREA